jgi:hypothetical protein
MFKKNYIYATLWYTLIILSYFSYSNLYFMLL